MMQSKSIFVSKMFWTNVLGVGIEFGILFTDTFKSNPELVVYVGFGISVANIILRKITKEPVHIIPPKE